MMSTRGGTRSSTPCNNRKGPCRPASRLPRSEFRVGRRTMRVAASAAGSRLPAPPPLHRDQALFLDFDGTLVDLAAAPDLVRVTAELPHLLQALSELLDGALALVSGRALDELDRLLAPF